MTKQKLDFFFLEKCKEIFFCCLLAIRAIFFKKRMQSKFDGVYVSLLTLLVNLVKLWKLLGGKMLEIAGVCVILTIHPSNAQSFLCNIMEPGSYFLLGRGTN